MSIDSITLVDYSRRPKDFKVDKVSTFWHLIAETAKFSISRILQEKKHTNTSSGTQNQGAE